ncbi:MAG TPA: hypothetical protein PLR69_09615, partial [Candidatus Limiplasma sp.]|nr:hypothetical protein [Candidatus Limiplasma sp.]
MASNQQKKLKKLYEEKAAREAASSASNNSSGLGKYVQLYDEGKTSSGRSIGDILGYTKNENKKYGSFVDKSNSILRGDYSGEEKTFAAIQDAYKDAYYARRYVTDNADSIDTDSGSGSSQHMLQEIEDRLKRLKSIQDRNFSASREEQQQNSKRLYDNKIAQKNALEESRYEQAKEQGMPDSLKSFQERGNQSIRDIAAYKRKQELNRLAQAALEASKNQNNNGGTPVVNGHGAALGRSFGDPTQSVIRSEQNTGMSEQLREKRNELASGLQNYSPK